MIRSSLPRATAFAAAVFSSFLGAQQWQQATPTVSPSARNSHAMAFDVARGVQVMFGGYAGDTNPPLGDTWEWNGTDWTQRAPAASPPPRWGHHLAYDSRRMRVVLFGGYVPNGPIGVFANDTWEFDGATWTQCQVATPPAGRGYGAMAYDSARGVTVLFGGYDYPSSYFADTWEWDGATWTQRTLPTTPSGRRGTAMAFDSARGQIVAFGGGDATTLSGETWTYDGTTWTLRAPATAPGARWEGRMAFDTVRGKAVLHGGADATYATNYGDTWEWDGTSWAPVAGAGPGGRHGSAMAFDARRGQTVVFGGRDAAGFFGDTWLRNATTATLNWTQASTNYPGIRVNYPLSTDPQRSRVLLFGGIENSNTWEWNGANWLLMSPATSPAWRHGPAIAYDPIRSEQLMFGGGQYSNILNQTWTWNGANWTQKSPSTVPTQRRDHVLVFDAARSTMLMYGGYDGTGARSDMWRWDGSNWFPMTPANNPGPWSDRTYAYDANRQEVVLYGAGSNGDQTWIWNGTNWIQRFPANNPGRRGGAGMAYHPLHGRTYLFGGEYPGGNFLGGTWVWDGVNWSPVTTANAPCNTTPYAGAYDPNTSKMLIFSGHPWASCGTWLFGGPIGAPATLATYGQGCAHSTNTPALGALNSSTPRLGQALNLRMTGLPNAPFFTPLGFLGFGNTTALGLPLPFSMGLYGMPPQCQQYVEPDPALLFTLVNAGGYADWSLGLPNNPQLLGQAFFTQGLVFDWTLPYPLPAVSTNAAIATIGL